MNTPNETDRYGSVTTRRTGETGSKQFAPFGRFGFEGSRLASDERDAGDGDVVRGEGCVKTRDHAGPETSDARVESQASCHGRLSGDGV